MLHVCESSMLCRGKQGSVKIRVNIDIDRRRTVRTMGSCVSDHQGIVGAQLLPGCSPVEPGFLAHSCNLFPEARVRTDATTESQQWPATGFCGSRKLRYQYIDHRLLKGGTNVRQILGAKSVLQKVSHGGLQAAETKVEVSRSEHTARKDKSPGITLLREAVHFRATRIAETQ